MILFAFWINLFIPDAVSGNGTSYFQSSALPTGNVLPMEEGKVSIEAEELSIRLVKERFQVPLSADNPSIKANVKVIYQLHNHLPVAIKVPIAFPHPGKTDQWKVKLDGKEIPLTGTVAIPRQQLIGESPHDEWVHPRTGERYGINRGDRYSEFREISSRTFAVTLEAGLTHLLQVEYEANLGMDEKTNLHPVYRFDYLLHPASYWSSFQNLSVKLEIPFDAEVYVNLPLQKLDSHNWEGRFALLPKEDLTVFLSPDFGPVIDLFHSRGAALGFFLLLALGFYPIGRLALSISPIHRRKHVSGVLFLLFLWAGYDILDFKILGYPLSFLHPVLFALYALNLLVLWKRMRRTGGAA
jgi:hypothetical protein